MHLIFLFAMGQLTTLLARSFQASMMLSDLSLMMSSMMLESANRSSMCTFSRRGRKAPILLSASDVIVGPFNSSRRT